MNWNSKTGEYTQVVRQTTQDLKEKVRQLSSLGYPTKVIAGVVGKSRSRVLELLKN